MREYNDFREISLVTRMENQKFQYRSVIKFLVLEGKSPSNIYKRMVVINCDHVPSPTTVFEWAHRFKDEQLNIEDSPRCARSITVTNNNETVKDIGSLTIEGRRITIQQIAYGLRCFNLYYT